MQPYWNNQIILVFHGLYFTSGSGLFASCFNSWFPTYEGPDGDTQQEVSAPKVTLVVAAVWMSYLLLNPMLTKLIVILVICHNLQVVHWRTANYGILSQCLSQCLPWTHQHTQSYCRAVGRCIPYDDGWYLCTSKVGTNNGCSQCMIWPDIFAVLLDLGSQWMPVSLLPILIFKLSTKPECVNECLVDLVSFILM